MNWRTLKDFPAVSGDDWRARKGRGRLVSGKAAVSKVVARWYPLVPLLVSEPGSRQFLPVMQSETFRAVAHRAAIRAQKQSIAISVATAAFFGLLGYLQGNPRTAVVVSVAMIMSLFLALDYWLVTRRIDALTERALFSVWVHRKGRVDAMLWIGTMLLAGGIQLLGQSALGGLEPLVRTWGIVYESVLQGEWWRVATGPFFHSGIAHWGANTVLLTFIGTIIGGISRRSGVSVFLLGSVAGVAASIASPGATDAYLGVSAGIFAMFGWCAGVAWRWPQQFPKHFAWTMFSFGTLNLVLAGILIPNSANIAHFAGLLFGIVWGVFSLSQIDSSAG